MNLRLSRVERSLTQAIEIISNEAKNSKNKSKTLLKYLVTLDESLLELQDILDEVKEHNECVKYWLRDSLTIIGGLFVTFLVFMLGDIEWYYKAINVVTITVIGMVTSLSFSKASQLYVRIRCISKPLHSCQILLHSHVAEKFMPGTKRKKAATSSSISHIDFMKTNFQVMRMIHRVSSPFLTIGYTVGNGNSFSPASAAQFLETVVIASLMFINSKGSTLVNLMTK